MRTLRTTFLLICLLVTGSLSASEFKVVGYLPAYRMGYVSLLNYNFITHVCASFINPDTTGTMSWANANMTTFVNEVHKGGAKAIASFGGGGDYSWGPDVAIYEKLLKTQQSRTAFIHKIMNYLRQHNLDGIDNDMEGNALALSTYDAFTQELADSVHAAGLEISAAFGVGSAWGVGLVAQATLDKYDYVMTMSYGGVGSWNWSVQDDGHAYSKYKSDIDHFINKGMAASKVLGGLPFYTVEFPSSAQSNYGPYHKTICDTYNDTRFKNDDVVNTDTLRTSENMPVYLNSMKTFWKKVDYAKKNGGGIMIWELGQDCYNGAINIVDSLEKFYNGGTWGPYSTTLVDIEKEIKAYPNPTENHLNFNFGTTDPLRVEIIDQLGAKIWEGKPQSTIALDQWAKGLYLAKIYYKEGVVSKRVIVK